MDNNGVKVGKKYLSTLKNEKTTINLGQIQSQKMAVMLGQRR